MASEPLLDFAALLEPIPGENPVPVREPPYMPPPTAAH